MPKHISKIASDIQKDGESWQSAMKRAGKILRSQKDEPEQKKKKKSEKISHRREDYPSTHAFFQRHSKK